MRVHPPKKPGFSLDVVPMVMSRLGTVLLNSGWAGCFTWGFSSYLWLGVFLSCYFPFCFCSSLSRGPGESRREPWILAGGRDRMGA